MEEGKIVNGVPPVTRRSKYNINWDDPAYLAQLSGKPVLAGRNIRVSMST